MKPGLNTDIPLLVDSEGCERATSYEKSEAFARFFSKKCRVPGRDLTSMDLPDTAFAGAPALTTVHFHPHAVHRLLARLDASKATGPDGISARVLKECERELAKPLCQLFALCFQHGVHGVAVGLVFMLMSPQTITFFPGIIAEWRWSSRQSQYRTGSDGGQEMVPIKQVPDWQWISPQQLSIADAVRSILGR